MKKNKITKQFKVILIIDLLIAYFTLLVAISFVRSPTEYAAVGDSIVQNEDFLVEAESGRAWADTDGLHLRDDESSAKIFSTVISLKDIQQIQIKLTVDCTEEFVGTSVIHIDLYANGYDTDEREFTVELKTGRNEIVRIIDKGANAPKEAQFRIFCLDPVQCDISDLSVRKAEETVHSGTWPCAIVSVVLVILLVTVILIVRKQDMDNQQTDVRTGKCSDVTDRAYVKDELIKKESVIMMDSIAHSASFFKLLSSSLPISNGGKFIKSFKPTNKATFELASIFAIFAVSFVTFYLNIVNSPAAFNSDSNYYALAGQDILSGNILLKGWFAATNLNYLLSLIYGIAGVIWNYNVALCYPVTALIWAALMSAMAFMIIRLNKSASFMGKLIRLLLFLGLFMNSNYFAGSGMLYAGFHIDVLIVGLLYTWNIFQSIENGKNAPIKTVLLSALCFLAVISDDMIVFFILIPAITVLFINLLVNKGKEARNRVGLYLLLTAIIIVTAKLFYAVAENNWGAIQRPFSVSCISVVTSGEIFDRLTFFLEGALNALGINVFGKAILSLENLELFLRFLLVISLFIFCCVYMFQMAKKKVKENIFNQFLLCVMLFTFLIIVFTTYMVPSKEEIEFAERIFIYFIVPMILFFSQADVNQNGKRFRLGEPNCVGSLHIGLFVCLSACLLGITGISKISYNQPEDYQGSKYIEVAEILKEKGLSKGYGTFWLANVTALASETEIEVKPIHGSQKEFCAYQWLSYDTAIWDTANFILVDDSGWCGITRDTITNQVGIPNEEVLVDNVTIMIYEQNVMPYIPGSGYHGKNLSAWWDFEDGEITKEVKINGTSFYSNFQPDADGYFTSTAEGQLLYGPYKTLYSGSYNISFYYDSTYDVPMDGENTIGYVDVCSDSGTVIHGRQEMQADESIVSIKDITLDQDYADIELRCYVKYPGVTIRGITIEKRKIFEFG